MRDQLNPKRVLNPVPEGCKDLGWFKYDAPEVVACKALGHTIAEHDNSLYLYRCTDVVFSCVTCGWAYHVDMSD